MAVDEQMVRSIARLARIHVGDGELARLARELSKTLEWVETLNEVDTTTASPMTSVTPMAMKMRGDTVDDGAIADRILANAPASEDGFFTVPKVID